MAYEGGANVQNVMVQAINLIFRYLQNQSQIQIWLYELDEYMNLVLENAEKLHIKC